MQSQNGQTKAHHSADVDRLTDLVERLVADADRVAREIHAEAKRVQFAHYEAMERAQHDHDEELRGKGMALASRDVIGQAKGITMAALHCTAEEAFALLVKQSQAENRKLIEIATELADRTARLPRRSQPGQITQP